MRELFAEMDDIEDKKKLQRNRNRGDLYKNITPDYYGYRDDDDGILVEKEKKAEVTRRPALPALQSVLVIAFCLMNSICILFLCVQVLRVKESLEEFTSKKRKVEEEVARSGGVYGSDELQKFKDNDRHTSHLVQQEISNDIAAKPINLNLLSGKSSGAGGAGGEEEGEGGAGDSSSSKNILKAHVVVPSQDDIVKVVLQEKKRSLLEKYVL